MLRWGQMFVKPRYVAEPGESSFEGFDLSVSILCMIVKAKKKDKEK